MGVESARPVDPERLRMMVRDNVRGLLLMKPWLREKLGELNGASYLIIEYWRTYDDVRIEGAERGPTNPLVILSVLSEVRSDE